MHTVNSDGDVSPRMKVMEAFVEGLDAIAITDHQPAFGRPDDWDYDQSYHQALSEAKKHGKEDRYGYIFEGHYDEKLELMWTVPESASLVPVPAEAFYLFNSH